MEGFVNLEGLGVQGIVDGHAIIAGRESLLADSAMPITAELRAAKDTAETLGQTAILAGWDGQLRALLVVADTVKPTSAEAMTRLRGLGFDPGCSPATTNERASPSPNSRNPPK